jgi:hypothetical protein
MSPLLEKPPEPVEKIPTAPARISEPVAGDPGSSVDTTDRMRFTFAIGASQSITESPGDASTERPIHVDFAAEAGQAPPAGRLIGSLSALTNLRASEPSAAIWIGVASTLKSDAARFRSSPLSRHSSVMLALADALTFTDPSDPTLDFQRSTVDRSLAVLSSPFVAESEEEALLSDLLGHGWNLAPAASDEPLTA